MNTNLPEIKSPTVPGALKSNAPWQRAFDLCVSKTRRNIKDLADTPRSWSTAADGDCTKWNEGFFEIGNWTSSFFTGMALLAWRETEDEYFLQQVLRLGAADALITKAKESLLQQLCNDRYLNLDENCRGVLRDGQVGFNCPGSAQNAYTSWGDHYLMEALDRELHKGETWW